jgi:hypothetical protein
MSTVHFTACEEEEAFNEENAAYMLLKSRKSMN